MTQTTWIIDGKKISQELKQNSFIPRIKALEDKGIVPGLAIVQIGSKQDSNTYIRMKQRLAKEVSDIYCIICSNISNSLELDMNIYN